MQIAVVVLVSVITMVSAGCSPQSSPDASLIATVTAPDETSGDLVPGQVSSETEQGSAFPEPSDGSGAPEIDWARSPFVGPSEQLSPIAFASVAPSLPYNVIDPDIVPGPYVIYRMGNQIAFMGTDPIVRIIQSPTDSDNTSGLDASDPAYRDAATFGTEIWNITLPDGTQALAATGNGSANVIFRRGNSLIDISAPPGPDALALVTSIAQRLAPPGGPG